MLRKSLAWFGSPRRWLRAVLLLDDTPHSIALGTAIGMFLAFTPTVGLQMVLVGIVAVLTRRLFHFNRLAALLMVYITNPLTIVPIYWACYRLGTIWFPADISREDFEHLLHYEGFDEWWTSFVELSVGIGLPLFFGSFIVSTITALVSYPTILWLLKQVRGEGPPSALAAQAATGSESRTKTPAPAPDAASPG